MSAIRKLLHSSTGRFELNDNMSEWDGLQDERQQQWESANPNSTTQWPCQSSAQPWAAELTFWCTHNCIKHVNILHIGVNLNQLDLYTVNDIFVAAPQYMVEIAPYILLCANKIPVKLWDMQYERCTSYPTTVGRRFIILMIIDDAETLIQARLKPRSTADAPSWRQNLALRHDITPPLRVWHKHNQLTAKRGMGPRH